MRKKKKRRRKNKREKIIKEIFFSLDRILFLLMRTKTPPSVKLCVCVSKCTLSSQAHQDSNSCPFTLLVKRSHPSHPSPLLVQALTTAPPNNRRTTSFCRAGQSRVERQPWLSLVPQFCSDLLLAGRCEYPGPAINAESPGPSPISQLYAWRRKIICMSTDRT